MTKTEIITRLAAITDYANSHDNGYHYELRISEWVKYGKDRTYFSIIETRDNSKHYVKKDYGFFDNNADEYVAGKGNINYDFGGNEKMEDIIAAAEEEATNADEAETTEYTVMSSQRFLDDEIVEEKKEQLIANNVQKIVCPITKAYLKDLEGNDLFILTNMHHTLAAARELGIEIEFEEVENDFTESTDPEDVCAEYYMGDSWFYINHADSTMIDCEVW